MEKRKGKQHTFYNCILFKVKRHKIPCGRPRDKGQIYGKAEIERRRQREEEERIASLEAEQAATEKEKLIQQEMEEKQKREDARLRARSREIMNAIYGR